MNIQLEYKKRKKEIKQRLKEFKQVKHPDLFYELAFCILTPQSSGFRSDECIQELKRLNFLNKKINPKPILKKKIRFHNNKTRYLLELKKNYKNILNQLNKEDNPNRLREFLLKNVKGYGLKESSHSLRNIGYENLAILDRHILRNLKKLDVIKQIPNSLTNKKYYEIENKFKKFSKKVNIPMDELDLLFWARETGRVFK
ncbi:MAG: N-glycosylase/DNA lyase [Nanoarchaeota archaeon]